ncbi:MAG TPA: hypothetical protein VGB95_05515 [Chitinophagales bacterium]
MKKFSELEYRRPDLDLIKDKFSDLLKKFEEAKNFTSQEDAIKEINALRSEFFTSASIAQVRNTIDVSNAYYDAENTFFDEVSPIFQDLNIQFYRSLSKSPFQTELRGKFGNQLFDLAEANVRSFDPKVIADIQEENRLGTEYSKLVASAEVEFDGKKLNLAGLDPYMQSTDRAVRKAASDAHYDWFAKNAATFDKIYDDLVKVRTRIAHKLGYKNFVELGYDRMNRTDYKADDVKKISSASD